MLNEDTHHAYEQLKSEAREGGQHPPTPKRLPLAAIKTAPAAFQPRSAVNDFHVRALVSAIRSSADRTLDPVTVWWSGQAWYVIDGHHRLEAYQVYNKERPERPVEDTPVVAFYGTPAEAFAKATAANSKDRLRMTRAEKSNAAWRMVCLCGGQPTNLAAAARAAGVSRPTIYAMRRCLEVIEADHPGEVPLNMSWDTARRMEGGIAPDEWNEAHEELQAIERNKRFYKEFAGTLATNPEVTGRALQLYSPDLPRMLLETGAFEDALEDLIKLREWEREHGSGVMPVEHQFY